MSKRLPTKDDSLSTWLVFLLVNIFLWPPLLVLWLGCRYEWVSHFPG